MLVDWTFWGSGIILGIFGLWVMYRAIFADRSRGRRRCPKCWYDMSESPEMRCPECGREALNDREFFLTRRRWKGLWVCLVIFLAAHVLWMQPKVRRDGWASVIPRTLLILALRLPNNGWAFDGLELRTQTDRSVNSSVRSVSMRKKVHDPSTLYLWQWRMFGEACIELSKDNPDIATRLNLIMWLRRAADTQDFEVSSRYYDVLYGYLTDQNSRVRQLSALLCTDPNSPELSTDMIQPLLDDPNQRVREYAIAALGVLAKHSSAPFTSLLTALEHDDDEVRRRAVIGLLRMEHYGHAPEDIFDRFVELYENDSSVAVQGQALNAIFNSKLQREQLAAFMRSAIIHPEEEIRLGAISTLSGIEPVEEALYLEIALVGLQDESKKVHRRACYILRHEIDTELLRPHLDLLKTLATDENQDCREAAEFHLSRLSEGIDESTENPHD